MGLVKFYKTIYDCSLLGTLTYHAESWALIHMHDNADSDMHYLYMDNEPLYTPLYLTFSEN